MPTIPGSKAPGAMAAGPAAPPADPNKVILTIGSEKITAGQFESLVDALPPQYQTVARGPRKREFAESIVQLKLLSQGAEKRAWRRAPKCSSNWSFSGRICLRRPCSKTCSRPPR